MNTDSALTDARLADDSTGRIGGPAPPPTAEEAAAFVEALRATRARLRTVVILAEDDLPISAGWRGPDAQPKGPPPGTRLGGIASSTG